MAGPNSFLDTGKVLVGDDLIETDHNEMMHGYHRITFQRCPEGMLM
jgi:hypothetical protein